MFEDERIDEAARALTQGEPRPGFRTRVLGRLERERPARTWRWIAILVAAAAIATIAFVLPRESTAPVEQGTPPVAVQASPPPPPAAVVARPALAVTAAVTRASVEVPAEPDSDLAIAPIELAAVTGSATIVDALADPPPLAVEDLAIPALDMLDTGHDRDQGA